MLAAQQAILARTRFCHDIHASNMTPRSARSLTKLKGQRAAPL
jgi:hypothetical protein